ncbi:MAG: alpha-galactosidase, partial [Clostridia bacterium]|nr:alpha-galactosidase [Clostridia bacterium]
MKTYHIGATELTVHENGQFVIGTEGKTLRSSGRLNCEVKMMGNRALPLGGNGFAFCGAQETETGLLLSYLCEAEKLKLEISLAFSESGVVVQQNKLTNLGETAVKLHSFSSTFREFAAYGGEAPYYEREDVRVHVCHSKWLGEGQWVSYAPDEIGLYPGSCHPWERATYRIQNIGSWSTMCYYPLVMVEDKGVGETQFVEIEGSHSWCIKVGAYGGFAASTGISLEATHADNAFDWYLTLSAGESYETERAFLGAVKGGFEEAVASLTAFKREDALVRHKDGVIPLCYNVYMNSLWGIPTPERVIPLISAAKEAGAEVFVIDGGWEASTSGEPILGDWCENPNHYAKVSIAELIAKIKEAGMVPGIWFELDACNLGSYGSTLDEDCLLRLQGDVVRGYRAFYNFTNPKVREYLHSRVRRMYDLGIRYIKNDYNQSTGLGCDNTGAESVPEGLRRNADAFYEFLHGLYADMPDLVIENCSCGAMREDNKILRRTWLQSTSDQEKYERYPSMACGSLALMPPEKAGIWSYPYPCDYDHKDCFVADEAYVSARADGAETVFNMVTGMLGVMYLSGRIDCCDEKNRLLVHEGVAYYKEMRGDISRAVPVYPTGTFRAGKKVNATVGLL